MNQEIKKAVEIINEIKSKANFKSYVLTGSGISKASNIPTFQGEDGLWEIYDFEEVATFSAWVKNPEKLWKMYQEGIQVIFDANPNAAHDVVAKLEQLGLCQYVITQNVDSLHQRAGSKNVIEVHGNLSRIKCTKCGHTEYFTETPKVVPPMCNCGNMMRPDVILYEEMLPEKEIQKSFEIANKADLVFVIGTSAEVYPAASLPLISKRNGAKILVFNPDKTDHAKLADVFIKGKSEETLPLLLKELIKE